MNLRVRVCGCVLSLLVVSSGPAQDRFPNAPVAPVAAPPATHPATAPADTSTPTGTLKLLTVATEEGDIETMRSLMIADDETERKMISARIDEALAFVHFRHAITQMFGEQAFDELTGNSATMTQMQAAIDTAQTTIENDRATVTVNRDVYELKRVNGRWLLSLAPMVQAVEAEMLEEALDKMAIRSEVIREVANEISEGRYSTTDEVGQAYQGKLMVAMMRQASAKQSPTTEPVKN